MNPAPKLFKGIQQLKTADNPYLPKFIFEEKDQLSVIDNKFVTPSLNVPEAECTFTGMTMRLLGKSMRININSIQLFPDTFRKCENSCKSAMKLPKQMTSHQNRELAERQPKKIFSWSWEGLGCFGIICAKPFAGDSSYSLLLQSYIEESKNAKFEAKVLKEEDFIADLKSLIGIWKINNIVSALPI